MRFFWRFCHPSPTRVMSWGLFDSPIENSSFTESIILHKFRQPKTKRKSLGKPKILQDLTTLSEACCTSLKRTIVKKLSWPSLDPGKTLTLLWLTQKKVHSLSLISLTCLTLWKPSCVNASKIWYLHGNCTNAKTRSTAVSV